MALPKRKTSKSRTKQRRAHFKVEAPPKSVCPNCGEPKAPHRVCMSCGFYKGRSVLEVAEE